MDWVRVQAVLRGRQAQLISETRLRTAIQHESLKRIGAQVGYTPHPSLPAYAYLTLNVSQDQQLEPGTRLSDGERVYETVEAAQLRVAWNSVSVPDRQPHPVSVDLQTLDTTDRGLRVGRVILIVQEDGASVLKRIGAVAGDACALQDMALTGFLPDAEPGVYLMSIHTRVFGYDAPEDEVIETAPAVLDLDEVFSTIVPGGYVALVSSTGQGVIRRVLHTTIALHQELGGTEHVTRLFLDGDTGLDAFSIRDVTVFAASRAVSLNDVPITTPTARIDLHLTQPLAEESQVVVRGTNADGQPAIEMSMVSHVHAVEGGFRTGFREALRHRYQPQTVRVTGNVVLAVSVTEDEPAMLAANPLGAVGETASESIEEIRRNIPVHTRLLGHLVTLADYQDFVRAYPGITKAHAAWQANHLILSVAGPNGEPVPDVRLEALKKALMGRCAPGIQLHIRSIAVSAFQVGGYVTTGASDDIPEKVQRILQQRFSFSAREPGQPVYESEIVAAVQNIAGVDGFDLDRLHLMGAPGPRADVLVAPHPGTHPVLSATLLVLTNVELGFR